MELAVRVKYRGITFLDGVAVAYSTLTVRWSV